MDHFDILKLATANSILHHDEEKRVLWEDVVIAIFAASDENHAEKTHAVEYVLARLGVDGRGS